MGEDVTLIIAAERRESNWSGHKPKAGIKGSGAELELRNHCVARKNAC
jgi:hypothetical protein